MSLCWVWRRGYFLGALLSSPSPFAGCGGCAAARTDLRDPAAGCSGDPRQRLAVDVVVGVALARGGAFAVGRGKRPDLSAMPFPGCGDGDGWRCHGGCTLAARLSVLWRQGWQEDVCPVVACSVGPRLGPGERCGVGQRLGVVAALVVGYSGAGWYGGLPAAWYLHGTSAVPATATVGFSAGVGSFAGGLF